MSDNYTDDNAYQNAKRIAQAAANASGKSMVLGYDNYSGWCHVDSSDVNAVAELGDVLIIEPRKLEPYLLRLIGANHPSAHRNELDFDTIHQVVVIAEGAAHARELVMANDANGDAYLDGDSSDRSIWSDPNKVECINLNTIREAGVVVVSDNFI